MRGISCVERLLQAYYPFWAEVSNFPASAALEGSPLRAPASFRGSQLAPSHTGHAAHGFFL